MKVTHIFTVLLFALISALGATAQNTATAISDTEKEKLETCLKNEDWDSAIQLAQDFQNRIEASTDRTYETGVAYLEYGQKVLAAHVLKGDSAIVAPTVKTVLQKYDELKFTTTSNIEALTIEAYKLDFMRFFNLLKKWEDYITYGEKGLHRLSSLGFRIGAEQDKVATSVLQTLMGVACNQLGLAYLKQDNLAGAKHYWNSINLVVSSFYNVFPSEKSNDFYKTFGAQNMDSIPRGFYYVEKIRWQGQEFKDSVIYNTIHLGEDNISHNIVFYEINNSAIYSIHQNNLLPTRIDSCGFTSTWINPNQGGTIPFGAEVEIDYKKVSHTEVPLLQKLHTFLHAENSSTENKLIGTWRAVSESKGITLDPNALPYVKVYRPESRVVIHGKKILLNLPFFPGNYTSEIRIDSVDYLPDGNTREGGNPCTIVWLNENTHKLQYKDARGQLREEIWERCELPDYLKMIK